MDRPCTNPWPSEWPFARVSLACPSFFHICFGVGEFGKRVTFFCLFLLIFVSGSQPSVKYRYLMVEVVFGYAGGTVSLLVDRRGCSRDPSDRPIATLD